MPENPSDELVTATLTGGEIRRLMAVLYWVDGCGDLYRKFARLAPVDPPHAREDGELLSPCCGAAVDSDTGFCPACRERVSA